MAFANNSYAKVWEVKDDRIRISTSYKNKEDQYVTDFSGWVELYGDAKNVGLASGDRVQLKSVAVSNNYDKEAQREYIHYKCFSLEKPE